jgi:Pentapeptide repeats (9 copies)
MSETEKPAPRLANDNVWYCLATLHGEQPIDGLDEELAGKNQRAWQRWNDGVLNSTERTEFLKAFAARTRRPELPPEPTKKFDFSHVHFVRPVIFEDFRFPLPTDFSSATFVGKVKFSRAQFNSKTDFTLAAFSGEANFSRVQFNAGVDLLSATFSKDVDFQNANFVDPGFRSVTFFGRADFGAANFSGTFRITDFSLATFSDIANFGSAVFSNEADFQSATFAEMAIFRSATFHGDADFSEATFNSVIYFNNATFGSDTIFANARFETQVPDFRGATMHEATEWHGVSWPTPSKDEYHAQQQVYTYERLKQEMERLKKHEDEQSFFRRELRARRGLSRALSWSWLLNLAYQLSSNYGNSIGRPLLWLLGVFAAGAAIFARAPIHCGMPMPIRLAVKLSFANIFVFLPDKREIMTPEMTACLSDTARAVSALQSVSGVVLLFLLGLALRNRFRMK